MELEEARKIFTLAQIHNINMIMKLAIEHQLKGNDLDDFLQHLRMIQGQLIDDSFKQWCAERGITIHDLTSFESQVAPKKSTACQ